VKLYLHSTNTSSWFGVGKKEEVHGQEMERNRINVNHNEELHNLYSSAKNLRLTK
jgi:hypothetical protein